jgi:predicted peptidase
MNALLLAVFALEAGAVTDTIQERQYSYKSDDGASQVFKYRLLTPEKIELGKKYPVVLFLHGAGERGADDRAQLRYLPTWMAEPKMRAAYPCFLIAPQVPTDAKWVNSPWDKKTGQPLPEKMSDSMKLAVGILDEVIKTEPVDTSRVYLTGLSMGGYGTWDLAERMPERFAAVVPICGGGDDTKADRLVGIPLWCWHGDADPAVPVERSRQMIAAIKKAGGDPKYTELPGVGHDSWTKSYTDPQGAIPWMFQQKKTAGPTNTAH